MSWISSYKFAAGVLTGFASCFLLMQSDCSLADFADTGDSRQSRTAIADSKPEDPFVPARIESKEKPQKSLQDSQPLFVAYELAAKDEEANQVKESDDGEAAKRLAAKTIQEDLQDLYTLEKSGSAEQFQKRYEALVSKYQRHHDKLFQLHQAASHAYKYAFDDIQRASDAVQAGIRSVKLAELSLVVEELELKSSYANLLYRNESRKKGLDEYRKVIELFNRRFLALNFMDKEFTDVHQRAYEAHRDACSVVLYASSDEELENLFLGMRAFMEFGKMNPLPLIKVKTAGHLTLQWRDTIAMLRQSLDPESYLRMKLSADEEMHLKETIRILQKYIEQESRGYQNFLDQDLLKRQREHLEKNLPFYSMPYGKSPFFKDTPDSWFRE